MKNEQSENTPGTSKWKGEIRFWIIVITVFGLLYTTGYHTNVIGKVQQVFLSSGVMQPDIPQDLNNLPAASREFYFVDHNARMHTTVL